MWLNFFPLKQPDYINKSNPQKRKQTSSHSHTTPKQVVDEEGVAISPLKSNIVAKSALAAITGRGA